MDAQTREYIDKHFDRLHTKLANLLGEKKKATLVKAGDIMKLTGWDKNKMRCAREAGTIECRKTKDGIFYVLESLPTVFIISD